MHVILVASWYPAVDDPARGRFVADQAEALQRTGNVSPIVLSFDPLPADSSLVARPADLAAASRMLSLALASSSDALNPRAFSLTGEVPVARLPIIDGEALPGGADGEARAAALSALAERMPFPSRGVVHAHTAYPDGFAGARLAERLGWPLVITEHASFVGRQLGLRGVRERYLDAVSSADRFIAVSDFLAGELRTAIPNIGEKLEVVPNPIRREDFRLPRPGDRDPNELLFVGYRKARKGIPLLLQAFANVLATRPATTLRLVGRSSTDAEEERWHAMAKEFAIDHAVTFDSVADRAGVADALARAALYVHPSPRETFGITTLEALASGLPVVATRSGGISGILEDPALGELVPTDDPPALAAAVLRTLARREEFDPQVLRAAVAPFSDHAVAQRLGEIYEAIGGDGGAATTMPVRRPSPFAGPIMVVGGSQSVVSHQLSVLPDDLRRLLLVVDQPPTADTSLRAPRPARSVGRIERRLLRLVRPAVTFLEGAWSRNPIASRRRREFRMAWESELRRRLGQIPGSSGGHQTPEVICLDAASAWVVEPLALDGSVRPVPGGVLWLADRWAALQGSARPSRDRISDATRSPTIGQS